MDPLTRLQAGIDQARPIVAAVGEGDNAKATPCAEWNVRQVLGHMIGTLVMFRDIGTQGQADPEVLAQDQVGTNAAESFDAAGKSAVAAWSDPEKLAGTAMLPTGEIPAQFALQILATDMVVHGWDVASATGQRVEWNPELVAETLQFSESTFNVPEMRGSEFQPPVPVPDDADDLSRLVAFLGRQP
jgi:uncharacterized protein (TIGR03086 family)